MPHIYTEQELTELLDATSKLRPTDGLRPVTYRTVYGLLASCGLRIGEAIRLPRTDVDLDCGVLAISDTKRRPTGIRDIEIDEGFRPATGAGENVPGRCVSTQDQKSLPLQIRAMRDYAARRG